jgi:fucose permease
VVTPDEGNKKIVVAVIDTPPPSDPSESTTPSASSSSLPSIGKEDGVIPKSEVTKVVDPRTTPTYRAFKTLAIGLMMCFMPIYYGLEMTVGSFLTTFSVESDLHLSKASGAYMTSVYWSMFTFVRLSTVFYIDYLGAEMNVIMNLCVILVANVFLIPWGATYEWCLWVGSTLMGVGCSSIWASALGYLEDYFPVSSRIVSLIMMSTALGDFVFPFVISHKITEYPNVFLDVTLFCSIAISLIFALVVVICKLRLRVKGTNAVAAASTGQEEKKHFH